MLEKLSSPIEVEIRWSSGVLDLGAVQRADVRVLDGCGFYVLLAGRVRDRGAKLAEVEILTIAPAIEFDLCTAILHAALDARVVERQNDLECRVGVMIGELVRGPAFIDAATLHRETAHCLSQAHPSCWTDEDDEHAALIAWLSVTNSGDHRPLRRSCDRIINTGASR